MKAELNRNIVEQKMELYVFDRRNYLTYENDTIIVNTREQEYEGVKPFLSLWYDVYDDIAKTIAEDYNARNGIKETNGEHLKDLRWVLDHFLSKDKK